MSESVFGRSGGDGRRSGRGKEGGSVGDPESVSEDLLEEIRVRRFVLGSSNGVGRVRRLGGDGTDDEVVRSSSDSVCKRNDQFSIGKKVERNSPEMV